MYFLSLTISVAELEVLDRGETDEVQKKIMP